MDMQTDWVSVVEAQELSGLSRAGLYGLVRRAAVQTRTQRRGMRDVLLLNRAQVVAYRCARPELETARKARLAARK